MRIHSPKVVARPQTSKTHVSSVHPQLVVDEVGDVVRELSHRGTVVTTVTPINEVQRVVGVLIGSGEEMSPKVVGHVSHLMECVQSFLGHGSTSKLDFGDYVLIVPVGVIEHCDVSLSQFTGREDTGIFVDVESNVGFVVLNDEHGHGVVLVGLVIFHDGSYKNSTPSSRG